MLKSFITAHFFFPPCGLIEGRQKKMDSDSGFITDYAYMALYKSLAL